MLRDLIHLPLPEILLCFVFVLTAIRKIGKVHLPIWLIMTIAAIIVLFSQQISLQQAYKAIDFNIILYLFGVFVIGAGLEESNYLEYSMLHLFKRSTNGTSLLALIILFASVSTMLLMNDTVAIIGTPAILLLCKKTDIPPLPLLLTLAYTMTLSSVTSPIANPQNLLIATELSAPFMTFLHHLFLPTLLNSILLFIYMRLCFKKHLNCTTNIPEPDLRVNKKLALLTKASVALMLLLITIELVLSIVKSPTNIPFSMISLVAATPILLGYSGRAALIKKIDWHTLLFFVSLFIFIESVWLSNYFQTIIKDLHLNLRAPFTLTSVSLILSQFISNVPLVALYLPFVKNSQEHLMLLSMASTMAGNLCILGAASNVIVIQNAEKRGASAFSFMQFSLYGIPITLLQLFIFHCFLF